MSSDSGATLGGVDEQLWDTDRVLTVPNILSFLRLLAIPLFTWLILAHHDEAAVLVLLLSAVTDWFDGRLARRLHQRSRLGVQLDPITDRLYILATIIALMVRGIVPVWFVLVLVGRDLMLLCLVPFLRRTGRTALPVNFVGKSGTFALLLAFPVVLIGAPEAFDEPWILGIGWAIAAVGALLYWAAGVLYVRETHRLLRASSEAETAH